MTRKQIKKWIAENTQFDVETVRFHEDGTISAIMDADKTFNGPHTVRLTVGFEDEFDFR